MFESDASDHHVRAVHHSGDLDGRPGETLRTAKVPERRRLRAQRARTASTEQSGDVSASVAPPPLRRDTNRLPGGDLGDVEIRRTKMHARARHS